MPSHPLASPAGCSRFPARTAANHVAKSEPGTARSPSQDAPHRKPISRTLRSLCPHRAVSSSFRIAAEQKEGTGGTASTARQHRSAAARHSASPASCQREASRALRAGSSARCTGCTPSRGSTGTAPRGSDRRVPLLQPPKHRSVSCLQPRLRPGAALNAAGPPAGRGPLRPAAPKSQPHGPVLPSHVRTVPRAAPGPAQPKGSPTERRWPQAGKGPGEAGGPRTERGAGAEPIQ